VTPGGKSSLPSAKDLKPVNSKDFRRMRSLLEAAAVYLSPLPFTTYPLAGLVAQLFQKSKEKHRMRGKGSRIPPICRGADRYRI
jgi:hypothetical protein